MSLEVYHTAAESTKNICSVKNEGAVETVQ